MEWWRPLDRPAARFARVAALAAGGLALVVVTALVVLPLVSRVIVRGLGLVVTGCVWLATSIGTGVSMWDVLWTIGRAAAGGLGTPMGSGLLAVLVVVGVVALYLLQRLLDTEEESGQ